jgi:hypothetical protein
LWHCDLITTCFAGQNLCCAEAFARARIAGDGEEQDKVAHSPSDHDKMEDPTCAKTWLQILSDLLNGKKLQGTLTTKEVTFRYFSRQSVMTGNGPST